MVRDHVFGLNSPTTAQDDTPSAHIFFRVVSAAARLVARLWCGMHGHLILLHFEPNKLSLQCGLCGYESEGWEVGRPMTSRRPADNRQARPGPERRRTLRPLPSSARLAS
jgi:hypothetical protein